MIDDIEPRNLNDIINLDQDTDLVTWSEHVLQHTDEILTIYKQSELQLEIDTDSPINRENIEEISNKRKDTIDNRQVFTALMLRDIYLLSLDIEHNPLSKLEVAKILETNRKTIFNYRNEYLANNLVDFINARVARNTGIDNSSNLIDSNDEKQRVRNNQIQQLAPLVRQELDDLIGAGIIQELVDTGDMKKMLDIVNDFGPLEIRSNYSLSQDSVVQKIYRDDIKPDTLRRHVSAGLPDILVQLRGRLITQFERSKLPSENILAKELANISIQIKLIRNIALEKNYSLADVLRLHPDLWLETNTQLAEKYGALNNGKGNRGWTQTTFVPLLDTDLAKQREEILRIQGPIEKNRRNGIINKSTPEEEFLNVLIEQNLINAETNDDSRNFFCVLETDLNDLNDLNISNDAYTVYGDNKTADKFPDFVINLPGNVALLIEVHRFGTHDPENPYRLEENNPAHNYHDPLLRAMYYRSRLGNIHGDKVPMILRKADMVDADGNSLNHEIVQLIEQWNELEPDESRKLYESIKHIQVESNWSDSHSTLKILKQAFGE